MNILANYYLFILKKKRMRVPGGKRTRRRKKSREKKRRKSLKLILETVFNIRKKIRTFPRNKIRKKKMVRSYP